MLTATITIKDKERKDTYDVRMSNFVRLGNHIFRLSQHYDTKSQHIWVQSHYDGIKGGPQFSKRRGA